MTPSSARPRTLLSLVLAALAAAVGIVTATSSPAGATIPGNGKIAYAGSAGLYVANADGSSPSLVYPGGGAPTWSPDGIKLGFVYSGNGYYLSTDADGSNAQALDKVGVTWPGLGLQWSHDGKRALYWDQTTLPGGGGAENVFVHNFVTHTDVDVLQRSALDRAPAWSPDETKIAFQSNSAESPSLWLMNADGTNARQIPHQPSGFNYSPKFSPDGTKLIFMNDPRVAGPSGWPMRLYVMGVDGTGLTPVGPADRFSSDASFSPDGTKILYSSRPASGPDDGSTGVYVMNADGSNPVLIVHGDYSGAAWQPVPSPNANVAPHAYGSAKNKAPLALFGDGSLSYDEDGWILRYEWRWGDNTPMTANKYAWHKYAAPGTYLVRLTVFDNNGAASTKKAWITVN